MCWDFATGDIKKISWLIRFNYGANVGVGSGFKISNKEANFKLALWFLSKGSLGFKAKK